MRVTLLILLLIGIVGCTHFSGRAKTGLCIPAVGRDVCGLPIAALLSRYDELYGKTVSVYGYLYVGDGDKAALSADMDPSQKVDHFSCALIYLNKSSFSGAYTREELKPGNYYANVQGILVDSRAGGICVGHLESADIFVIGRLDHGESD